jgi:hypothetical protein
MFIVPQVVRQDGGPLQEFECRDADLREEGVNVTGDEKPNLHL